MKSRLYIHLHDSEAGSASWASLAQGEVRPSEVQRGQLAAIPAPTEETHVTLFVPASDVLLTGVNIPSRSRKQLASATPFALEEQLIEDVDAMHFALGKSDAQGRTSVATIANNRLEQWLARLAEHNIKPDAVYSEAQALPVDDTHWCLLQLDGRCVLRSAVDRGYGLDCANLGTFLERMASNDEHVPQAINVISCTSEQVGDNTFTEALPLAIQKQDCQGDALVSLVEGSQVVPGINLLQGRYERKRPVLTGLRKWIPAAAMLFAWLFIQLGVLLSETSSLSEQEQQLKQDIVNLYKNTVPGARRVVNARLQMQQQIDALKGGGSESSFLDLLSRGGEVFSKTNGVELTSISYRDGTMDIALTLSDLQGLDNIKQSLIDKLGVEVDIQSATPKGKIIEARIRIRRAS